MSSYGHDELVSALRAAVVSDHRRRRRKLHAAVAASALALFVGGTVAAATNMPWWQPERSKANVLVQTRLRYDGYGLTAGSLIALWQAPSQGGGFCLLLGTLHAGVPKRAGECQQIAGDPIYSPGRPIDIRGAASGLAHGLYDHLLTGSVDPTSGIVKVVLEQPTGAVRLAFAHGWFLGDTAPTKTLAVPDAYVIGYDASGHEVARVRVWNWKR
jgi:hypothetical protein